MKLFVRLTIFLLATIVVGCKKDDDTAPQTLSGKEYFPDTDGIERVYSVDSIAWDEFTNTVDTFRYFYKEVIASHFNDNQGRPTQRIEHFLFDSTAGKWVIWKVQVANLTNTTAEVVENNYRFLRLTFPVKLNNYWNGNTFNSLEEQRYKIIAVHEPAITPYIAFDSTLTVLEQDDFTLIYDRYAESRYATGVGMYFRKVTDVTTSPANLQIIGGYKYQSQLVSFTKP